MTNDISTLRNSNYGASRQSIMDKYELIGDGKIDLAELHAFVDDYIINITNNDTLLDRVSNLRRLIGFGTILLLILALSNLGTAILAANISKDTVIVNGRFVANDGSAKAVSCMNAVESITKVWETEDDLDSRRNLAVDGAATNATNATNATATASSPYACFTRAEIDAILERSTNGAGTSVVIRSNDDDESTSETVVPIQGTGYSNQTQVSYPASNVVFTRDTRGLCAGGRRKLYGAVGYNWEVIYAFDDWIIDYNSLQNPTPLQDLFASIVLSPTTTLMDLFELKDRFAFSLEEEDMVLEEDVVLDIPDIPEEEDRFFP